MPERNPTVGWHIGEPKTPTYDGFRFTNSRRLPAEVIYEAETAARKVANARLFRSFRPLIGGGYREAELVAPAYAEPWPMDEIAASLLGLAFDIQCVPPGPPKPVRLTQQQMDAIPRGAEDQFQRAPWFAYTGVPVERVDEISESTPWTEGWIRCPYCDTPANVHPGETECKAFLAAHGQHVGVVPPPLTEEGRVTLGVYRPGRFGYLR